MHLGEGSPPEAVGTDPLQSHTVTGIPENFISAGFVDMPSTMPPRKQMFLFDVRLVRL